MEGIFDSLGLNGLQPGLQWLILFWGLACVVSIPVELFFWFALRRTSNVVNLGTVATPSNPSMPAFAGENVERKAEHLARGDAYAGPELGEAGGAKEIVRKSGLGLLRRIVFWALILLLAGVGAWLIFGSPFAGTEIDDALEGVRGKASIAGKGMKDVLASVWFLVVLTLGRVAMFFVEQKYSG